MHPSKVCGGSTPAQVRSCLDTSNEWASGDELSCYRLENYIRDRETAKTNYESAKAAAITAQETMEAQFCVFDDHLQTVCNSYKDSYDRTVIRFNEEVAEASQIQTNIL